MYKPIKHSHQSSGRWSPFERLDNSDLPLEKIQPPTMEVFRCMQPILQNVFHINRDNNSRMLFVILLINYKITVVCDDSGSMRTPVDHTGKTRWDGLREIVKVILEITVIFDSNGVDIHFLNRPPILRVTDPTVIDEQFSIPPRGYTPLVPVLTRIFSSPEAQRGRDKKVLVFIATDGTPTDARGNVNIDKLDEVMTRVRNAETTHVMFLICTDDPACVAYLVDFDERMANVDVTDDFFTEREKVWKKNGPNYPFSKGDYIAKTLLGAIDPEIDAINDTPWL
ncbi:unnamed protein product [Adineta ricciae]|uniref:VWFA domain-containing protein n=1 Tax=Adineta ricciae TaxID=249248 RepID=A0A815I5A4_ADIRI|nr:unnamed protein product [Adineta ricciae]